MRLSLLALMAISLGAPAFGDEPATLDAAYQKEFAYLLAEKAALEQRLGEVKGAHDTVVGKAKRELDGMQGKLVGLQTKAEATEDLLSNMEQSAESARAGQDLVDSAVFQATSSLEREGFALTQPAEPTLAAIAPVLSAAYTEATVRLEEGRTMRTGPGTYYLADGTQVQGDIVHVGQVASFGVNPPGALKPVGAGRMQLWRDGGASTAEALAAGSPPKTMGIFLYENAAKGIEESPEKTIMSVVRSGGPAGLVIILLGFAAIVLAFLRAGGLGLLSGSGEGYLRKVAEHQNAGRRDEALKAARSGRGAVSRVVTTTLERIELPHDQLEDVVGEALLREQPAADRFATAILVIAAVAPLLGLLGTVTGMIATFDIITEFGTGDPRRLSGGISEALVTTQLGLIVAIPSLLVGNLLGAWSNGIMARVERSALRIMNGEPEETEPDHTGLSLAQPPSQASHAG